MNRLEAAMWSVWCDDVAPPAGKLSAACGRFAEAIRAGETGKAVVARGDVEIWSAALHTAWQPWLGLGWTVRGSIRDAEAVVELHEAVLNLYDNPPELKDDELDDWYARAHGRLCKAALALWDSVQQPCEEANNVVSKEYVVTEVKRSIEHLTKCQEALKAAPTDLPTKAISLASGAAKNAVTLLTTIKEASQPKKEESSGE